MLHFVFKCFVYFSLKNNICDIKKVLTIYFKAVYLIFVGSNLIKGQAIL